MKARRILFLKLYDWIIIIFSILGIVTCFFAFHRNSKSRILCAYVEGKKTTYPMHDADIILRSSRGIIKLRVRDGRAKVVESTCPDGWCKGMGWIREPGDSIVCLPSRIFIIIEQDDVKGKDRVDAVTK